MHLDVTFTRQSITLDNERVYHLQIYVSSIRNSAYWILVGKMAITKTYAHRHRNTAKVILVLCRNPSHLWSVFCWAKH